MGLSPIRKSLGACALVVAMIGWASPASAFVRTTTSIGAPMYWNRTILTITAYTADAPAQLSSDDIANAVRGAAAAWSREQIDCTSLEVRVDTANEASARVEVDYTSRLTFRRTDWCRDPPLPDGSCYDSFALAVTSVFARKKDGEIVDADMEINAVNFSWSDLGRKPEGSQSLYDLQNALTHEMGHFIGLDHTCVVDGGKSAFVDNRGRPVPTCSTASEDILATTMVATVIQGDTERRTLSADEKTAVCSIYPALDLKFQSEAGGGCSLSPWNRAAPRGAVVFLFALAIVSAAARAFRRRSAAPSRATSSDTDRARNP